MAPLKRYKSFHGIISLILLNALRGQVGLPGRVSSHLMLHWDHSRRQWSVLDMGQCLHPDYRGAMWSSEPQNTSISTTTKSKNGLKKKKKKREKSSDIPHHDEMTKWMYDGYHNTLEEKNMLVCCSRQEKSKIQVKTNAIKACFFWLEIEGFSIAKCYFSKESI